MAQQHLPIRRKPTHRLYRVLGDGEAAIWTPIGAAWPNKDRQGFSCSCVPTPLAGRIVTRMTTERAGPGEGQLQPLPIGASTTPLHDASGRLGGAG